MSSGGGGDGGAQQRAEQDEYRKAQARNRVNAIFGIDPTKVSAPVDPLDRFRRPDPINTQSVNTRGTSDPPTYYGQRGSPFVPPTPEPVVAPQDTTDYGAMETEARGNKAARDALYQTTANNAFDLNKSTLDRDHGVAQRQNKFQLFRQGLAGGSVDADQNALLGEATDRATLNVRNAADTVGNDFRAADEQTRLDILRQISGGLDANSAIQSGIRGMQLSSDRANQASRTDIGSGLLDDAGLLYQSKEKAAGMKAGMDWYSKMYSPSTAQAGSFAGTKGGY